MGEKEDHLGSKSDVRWLGLGGLLFWGDGAGHGAEAGAEQERI